MFAVDTRDNTTESHDLILTQHKYTSQAAMEQGLECYLMVNWNDAEERWRKADNIKIPDFFSPSDVKLNIQPRLI